MNIGIDVGGTNLRAGAVDEEDGQLRMGDGLGRRDLPQAEAAAQAEEKPEKGTAAEAATEQETEQPQEK